MPTTLALIVAFAPQSSGFFSPVAGTVGRIPAEEIEALVVKCVRGHLNGSSEIENTPLIHDHVVRVEVQSHQLVIELVNAKGAGPRKRNFEARVKAAKTAVSTSASLSRDNKPRDNARQRRAFRAASGNLRFRGTAWWA